MVMFKYELILLVLKLWNDIDDNMYMGIDLDGNGQIRGDVHGNVTIWISRDGIRING